ncbi:MAG: hypothetical protein PGN30_10190 [Mycolicibacterium neoaurum]|uniref:hypothetical protein n=1 Tax=Mycolicibacterium neoaurum TaxID=1795 RepID=UPI002FF8E815
MLSLPNATVVTPKRTTVVFGEKTPVPMEPVEIGYLLGAPNAVQTETGVRYTRSGTLYAARGTDLQTGDQITLPEGTFGIVAPAELDYVSPMSGHDFGVKRLRIELGG